MKCLINNILFTHVYKYNGKRRKITFSLLDIKLQSNFPVYISLPYIFSFCFIMFIMYYVACYYVIAWTNIMIEEQFEHISRRKMIL